MDLCENLMKTLEPFPRHTVFCSPNQQAPQQDIQILGTCSGHCGLELSIHPTLLLCPSCTPDTGKWKQFSNSLLERYLNLIQVHHIRCVCAGFGRQRCWRLHFGASIAGHGGFLYGSSVGHWLWSLPFGAEDGAVVLLV